MATEDNTSVIFNFNNIISDGAAGTVSSPVTIILNRGQSYLLRDPFQNATVSGLLVTSDKDIAVASGSMHSSQLRVDFSPKRDGGVDVLIPIKNLGTDHVVVVSLASPSQEYAIIVAVEDSTEIYIDGGMLPFTTLNKGQFYQYKPNKTAGMPTYIRTSIPAYVYYVSGLNTEEVDMGLAGSISECRGSRKISFARFTGSGVSNAIQIVIPNTGLASLMLNGSAIVPPLTAIPVPGLPTYSAVTIPNTMLAVTNTLESDQSFAASQVVGSSDGGAFGYLSSFTSRLYAKDPVTDLATNLIIIPPVCNLDSLTQVLRFEGCGANIKLQASRKGALTDTIIIRPDSTSFTYVPNPGAVGTDTITLSFVNELGVQGAVCLVFKLSNPNVEVLINGNDTLSVCGNFSSTLTPSISGGLPPITYLWSTGAMTPTLPVVVNTSTTYSLVVTDSIGCKDTAFVRINVDTQAPTITCPAPQMVSCTSLIPAADTNLVVAVDPEGGPVTRTFVKDSIAIATQTCANRYVLNRIYQATDTCGNISRCIQLITVNDVTPPTITTIPANVTVSCANLVPLSDTLLVTVSDGCLGFVRRDTLPDVRTIGTCRDSFTITRTYRATDACGNTAIATQIITVYDQTAPLITAPGPITVSCANLVPLSDTLLVTVSDGCLGFVRRDTLPDVRTIGTCRDSFTITRTYRATDACGNTAIATQIITVYDQTAPLITAPGPITVSCANLVPLSDTLLVTVSDACLGFVRRDTLPDVRTIGTCRDSFTITRTYRATDACGNIAIATQIIRVYDQIAPLITAPGPITVSCANLVPPSDTLLVTVSDGCLGFVRRDTLDDIITPGICDNRFTITRTYRATDACGNTATATQIITVNDLIAPTPPAPPANLSYACIQDTIPGALLSATDNCNMATVPGVYSVTVGSGDGSPANPIFITRKWTFTDVRVNMRMITAVDTINNTTMPQVPNPPADTLIMCLPLPAAPTLVLSNGCGQTSIGVVTQMGSGNGCDSLIKRIWTFDRTAVSLPDTMVMQLIRVRDTIEPTLPGVAIADTVIFGCGVNFAGMNQQIDLPAATDNCSVVNTQKRRTAIRRLGCLVDRNQLFNTTVNSPYELRDVWIYTDACGNTDSIVRRLLFYDTIPPSVTIPAD
ncbi:MAG: IgGFc-binding protein [Saprospiraceae bacterium]|nr:IgGFc-binding protein [Saprospiraceae bacterium]